MFAWSTDTEWWPGSGDLTTYKELCSLATDLGKPDLIYRFMDIANHQMAMNSRRGAAFGFARIAKLAGDELQPHVSTIVPRLYRYLHDPNGKVQDAMAHIWRALVDNPKKVGALTTASARLLCNAVVPVGIPPDCCAECAA